MSEMLEKIRAAMHKRGLTNFTNDDARAVVETMVEPTGDMVGAVYNYGGDPAREWCYKIMMKAALK